MSSARMTQSEFPLSFGAFKPVGHVVIALPPDARPQALQKDLQAAGFAAADVLVFSASEMAQKLHGLLPGVSEMAGFGSEVQTMRRYARMAEDGHQWVVVYAPDAAAQARAGRAAQAHRAILANAYKRLTVEELI